LRPEVGALRRKDEAGAAHKLAEELGDLLFVMANIARYLRIDPKASLPDANAKFVRRFRKIEAAMRAEGRTRGHDAGGNGPALG
jgi:nucleoside triphosphate diphosphatase